MCLDTYTEPRRYSFVVVLGRGYWWVICPAAWKALRWLTSSKWTQGWKSFPSPGCQFWFSRAEDRLKLPSSFWWWMRSESVISAFFLLVCLLPSPLASVTNDMNRVSYQKVPAQGNKGNGPWMLRYPFSAGVFFEARCKECCPYDMLVPFKVYLGLSLCRQKALAPELLSWHLSSALLLLCFLGKRRFKM